MAIIIKIIFIIGMSIEDMLTKKPNGKMPRLQNLPENEMFPGWCGVISLSILTGRASGT